MFTTSAASATSVTAWRANSPPSPVLRGFQETLCFSGNTLRRLVFPFGRFEQVTPARHLRPPAQQRTTLACGHPSPDAEIDAVVQRLGQTFSAYRTAHTHQLGPVLLGSAHEQTIRIGVAARRMNAPVRVDVLHTPSSYLVTTDRQVGNDAHDARPPRVGPSALTSLRRRLPWRRSRESLTDCRG